ncbi:GNAT family N-acetyltransferase [Vibrio penaeicida]|uniref:GNAT family N-acetyltransferase n=1 Tax=Vibrio penaeicida TaxID=104609 RepID=UPI000CEA6EA3|nr:GNAT family N-acetyltransferase [Vibrio penaeicida]
MVSINPLGEEMMCDTVTYSAFDHFSMVCKNRFRQSLEQDLFHVLLLFSEQGKPIGYCSYWTDIVDSERYSGCPVFFYQIHYVFIQPEYRGKKYSVLMAKRVVCKMLEELRSRGDVAAFCDKSVYTSNEGNAYGRHIRNWLSCTKQLPFV